jgi:hypothetical protein
MSNKLFVFGIGGTGSRVIKALTMLLASGIEVKSVNKIIPILIDPDTNNGDLLNCIELMKSYRTLHNYLCPDNTGFFSTNIATLSSLGVDETVKISNTFDLNLGGTLHHKFGEFLNYSRLEHETQLLLNLLYSHKNFEDTLTKGFLGNPNVGSVVLNKLKDTPEFNFFASNFSHGDRIFIISSIFGGTGAAGFPLLLKLLREEKFLNSGANAIKNSKIGACVVLPYFNLIDNNNSSIDSNNFITKTKAALSYYNKNLRNLDAMFYIGDEPQKAYENYEGGPKQKNNAHIVELLAALSVIKFSSYGDTDFNPNSALFHEYSLKNESEGGFDILGSESKKIMAKNLTQLFFLHMLIKEHINDDLRLPWAKDTIHKHDFLTSDFYRTLKEFLQKYYYAWLQELNDNDRAFSPLALNSFVSDMSKVVINRPLSKELFGRLRGLDGLKDENFDLEFEKHEPRIKFSDPAKKFMELMWVATSKLFDKKYKNI